MFRRQLRRNVRRKLRSLGWHWPVDDAVGHLTIHVPSADRNTPLEPILRSLQQLSGIVWLTHARRLRPHRFTEETQARDFAQVRQQLLMLARAQYRPGRTFCIRVNRGNKHLPFTSLELAARLGQEIREHTEWQDVDLNHPDLTFHVDLRCAATYLFGEKLRGPAGLPVGTSGRVLALLSGGIDSPVAAYLMAKRGCRIDFIHFTAASMQEDEARQSKIWRLTCHLSEYTLGSRLYVVPYVHFDLALLRQRVEFEVVLFRRFMVRVAERLARKLKARALVTGDNLSQVASQTMTNLDSASRACEIMTLRPIVAFDKGEIIALAEKIGTYQLSLEAYKDCCALISHHPRTRSNHQKLVELEQRVFPDYEQLIERTLADAVCLDTQRKSVTPARP